MHVIIRSSIQQCNTGEVLSRFERDDTAQHCLETLKLLQVELLVILLIR